MVRYLPGALLAVFGVIAYAIGCILYLAQRRQSGRGTPQPMPANDNETRAGSKTLIIYAIAMMILGILALGGGLYALEMTEIHVLSH